MPTSLPLSITGTRLMRRLDARDLGQIRIRSDRDHVRSHHVPGAGAVLLDESGRLDVPVEQHLEPSGAAALGAGLAPAQQVALADDADDGAAVDDRHRADLTLDEQRRD